MKTKLITTLLALVLCMGAFSMPASAFTPQQPDTAPSASASADPEQPAQEKPFTPDGQATVTDNATNEDGKEFYTITTPNENVFYLVIDKQREDKNVYFLNAVTEADLMALAEGDKSADSETAVPEICRCKAKCLPGEVDTTCPVCLKDLTACTAKAVEPAPDDTQAEPPKKESNGGSILFILIAVAAVGGAGWYFKVYKPKKDLDGAEDMDDILAEDDGQTVNEDGEDDTIADTEEAMESDDYPDDYPYAGEPDEPDEEPGE